MDNDPSVLQAEAYAFHQEHAARTPELYQPATLKRIRGGADVATVAYVNARRRLDELRRSIPRTFEGVDLLITPTTPVPPFTIAELVAEPDELRAREILTLRNTRPFNVLGLPTISVPCGFTAAGLPMGLQITGRPGEEATVLRLAFAYERVTDWHKRRPGLVS
jgi:Asp-tRNA(Asn)/Glu-tRNA(Gln) amidotransferase A subunit family amidase